MFLFRMLFLFVVLMLSVCNVVSAVTVEARLPDWHKTEFSISDWNPDSGLLTVQVSIEAKYVTLRDISAQIHATDGIKLAIDRRQRATLKKGDSSIFMFQLQAKPGFNGWIEIELKAKPDLQGMMSLVESKYCNTPITMAIVKSEVSNIKQPIYIGTSMPISLTKDIALSTTIDMVFSNEFAYGKDRYYIWYPPQGKKEKDLSNEAMRMFGSALRDANAEKMQAVGKILISRLNSNKSLFIIEKEKGETFSLPASVAIGLISADMAIIKAVTTKDTKPIEEFLKNSKFAYARPFMYYNLALLQRSIKNKAEAVKNLRRALTEIPAWPIANTLLKDLDR